MVGKGCAVQDLAEALGARHHAEGGAAARAQRALVDRAARVALDMDRLPVPGIDQLRAADRAIRADAGADRVRQLQPRAQGARHRALRRLRLRGLAGELARERPVPDETGNALAEGLAGLLHPAALRGTSMRNSILWATPAIRWSDGV